MRTADPSDADLLGSGEASDFGWFYDRHLDAVLAFIGRRTHQPEAIFDLAAETFARALEHRGQFECTRGPAIGWLLGIARNLIIDSARRGRIEATSRLRLGMAPVDLSDDQLTMIAARGRVDLRAALRQMHPEQREAVIRRVVLEEPYAAIAAELRCSEQVARKRVSRGLMALRANLGGQR
jgi:RNA polymerase sigma factor (sigma-70 family)